MKLAAMFGSSSGAIATAAVGAVVVVAGAVGFTVFNIEEEPAVVAPEPAIVVPVPLPVVEAPVEVVAEAPVVAPEPSFEAPRLDLVRVAPDGSTVIAGQTSPNLAVAILLDGEQIELVTADASGDFVALLSIPASDIPRTLSAEARVEGAEAIAGVETVLIAPFAAPDVLEVAEVQEPEAVVEPEVAAVPDVVAALDVEVAPDVAAAPVIEETPAFPDLPVETAEAVAEPLDATAPEVEEEIAELVIEQTPEFPAAAPAAEPAAPLIAPDIASAAPNAPTAPELGPTPTAPVLTSDARPVLPRPARAQAPAVVIAGPEGLRVVQGPADEPAVQTSVRLDAISYNADGAVILAGRGPAQADIQVYINNQPIQLGEIGPGGDWSLQLPDVDPGTYTLAVAEIAPSGETASRVETPFLREDPERVAAAPVQQDAGINVITVQPGFTLWGMAEDTFGDGILYVQIFEENRDQIRDPNWIFPGQIFRMPLSEGVDAAPLLEN